MEWTFIVSGIVVVAIGIFLYLIGRQHGAIDAHWKDKMERLGECRGGDHAGAECPCRCGGMLLGAGYNRRGSVAFLACPKCKCKYAVRNHEAEEDNENEDYAS